MRMRRTRERKDRNKRGSRFFESHFIAFLLSQKNLLNTFCIQHFSCTNCTSLNESWFYVACRLGRLSPYIDASDEAMPRWRAPDPSRMLRYTAA